ncbi:MAG: hypothetical protein ABI068_09320 [Ktedonobacterales bacterium]
MRQLQPVRGRNPTGGGPYNIHAETMPVPSPRRQGSCVGLWADFRRGFSRWPGLATRRCLTITSLPAITPGLMVLLYFKP